VYYPILFLSHTHCSVGKRKGILIPLLME